MQSLQFNPLSTLIRESIASRQPWCEAQLGCSFDEVLQVRLDVSIAELAAASYVKDSTSSGSTNAWRSFFLNKLESSVVPPDTMPAVKVRSASRANGSWLTHWLDCPVAMKFSGLPHPVIAINVTYVPGAQGESLWREVLLVRKDELNAVLALFREAEQKAWQPSIRVMHGGYDVVSPCRWDDLVLDPLVVRLLRSDYESFFLREPWFKEKRLPFRRGYLLYGPPGNGKTSAIRAMLSRPGIVGHSMNLLAHNIDDDDLSMLFRQAGEITPSVLLLEDLDRCFDGSRREQSPTRISLQHLLNCLDGAATRDGIIVVATANNPTALDPAILRRPGRFDRIVAFQNPTRELMVRYFQKFMPELSQSDLEPCLAACEGFSFAQLQEIYILASQNAYESSRAVNPEDLAEAAEELRRALYSADWKNMQQTGFKAQRLRF